MNLSEHFSLKELIVSDLAIRHKINNNPNNNDVMANLTRLAQLLEKVRTLFNKPIHINSAYRSLEVNNLLGSKPSSQHCIGCAADITINGITPALVIQTIVHSNIPYDQIIKEYDTWVHISIPINETARPRKQALIIDNTGTRPYNNI